MKFKLRDSYPEWFDERGYFKGKNAKSIADFLAKSTGFKRENIDAVKVDNYVYIFFAYQHPVLGASLYKLKIPANVIYVVKEEHIEPVYNVLREYYVNNV